MLRREVHGLAPSLHGILTAGLGTYYTAASVLVIGPDGELAATAVGKVDAEQDSEDINRRTPFDLASLTKVFTATAILRLVGSGHVRLEDPIGSHLNVLSENLSKRSIRSILTHSSGLPAMLRLYGDAPPSDPRAAILAVEPLDEEGIAIRYSDVGFMLLGLLVERYTGLTLPRATAHLVLSPLGLADTAYGPCAAAPATEYDRWRGRRIRGEVHDENAWVLGGAAGHAGLFGPASDVARLAMVYLQPEGSYLPHRLLREAISEQASDQTERRGLGWDLRCPEAGAEAGFSRDTFGHYGFTGTAFWADPQRQIVTVLLTNRVYFGRDGRGVTAVRKEVFDTVVSAVSPVPQADVTGRL